MWFKQIQLFQLTDVTRYSSASLQERLEPLAFSPCLPLMPFSQGWVSPVEEEKTILAHAIPGYIMLCLQIEEKILPATVVRHILNEKIKQIELSESRKVYKKEKLSLKDDIIMTLMPRAFSKLTRVYGYIDLKSKWLVLGTDNAKKSEQFISMFKKCVSDEIHSHELKKISTLLTGWLTHQNYPTSFAVEKNCVLQDIKQQTRIIRCQQQDLFANGIKALIKDGCEIKQVALSWQDRLSFMLSANFSLSGIKYQDAIIAAAKELEPETEQQIFNADFLIMAGTLASLLTELLQLFMKSENLPKEELVAVPEMA